MACLWNFSEKTKGLNSNFLRNEASAVVFQEALANFIYTIMRNMDFDSFAQHLVCRTCKPLISQNRDEKICIDNCR